MRHDNFTLSDLNIILAGHSAAGSPAAVKLAVTAAAAGDLSVPSLLPRHCGRNVPGRIVKIGRISCIFQTGIVRAAHFQANNPLAVAQNHIADAFNDNQTVVRSFGAEADRNFNAFDNQGYYRTLGHIQSFFAQIDISKDIIAPDTFRSNDHIVRIGNIDLYIKAELGRVKRNFLNPVTPLKPLSKKGIRRMAVTGLIRRRVHSRTAADAAADHSGAAGAGRTVDDININNRVGQALGINTFTSDIKDIFVAGAAKDNNVGIDANVSPFARIEQMVFGPEICPSKVALSPIYISSISSHCGKLSRVIIPSRRRIGKIRSGDQ